MTHSTPNPSSPAADKPADPATDPAVTWLAVEPLSARAFAPFGDVIETAGRPFHHINSGMVERYHDLAEVDVLARGGKAGISLFVAKPYDLPLRIRSLERHPLSSQAFIPLTDGPFLVVVAPIGDQVGPGDLRAFLSDGRQGVNYRPGVWHHVLLAIRAPGTFAVIDRIGDKPNCDLMTLPESPAWFIDLPKDRIA